MKKSLFVVLAICTFSLQAAELICSTDNISNQCHDLYEVFMAQEVCFKGDVNDATRFNKLELKYSNGIRFLEGQVNSPDRMLLFVEESEVEQLRYIERCHN